MRYAYRSECGLDSGLEILELSGFPARWRLNLKTSLNTHVGHLPHTAECVK